MSLQNSLCSHIFSWLCSFRGCFAPYRTFHVHVEVEFSRIIEAFGVDRTFGAYGNSQC